MKEYFNEGTPHLSMAGIPSPFGPKPILITDMLQGFREELFSAGKYKKPKRNSNYTKPKKRRKK